MGQENFKPISKEQELRNQIADAERTGDTEYANELKEELEELTGEQSTDNADTVQKTPGDIDEELEVDLAETAAARRDHELEDL